jgi:hypothetical protein
MILDAELDERLGQLEARVPGDLPPAIRGRWRARRILGVSLAGTTLNLVLASAVVGGTALVLGNLLSAPGVENPGQPLYGAGLECMSPPGAAAYLREHGFTDVVWQVEWVYGKANSRPSVQVATPPEHGYVIPGAILSDGRLHMVVEQGPLAGGVGQCFGNPTP